MPLRPPLSASAWTPLLREALAREGRFRLPLRGTSMLPTLPVECEIEVAPLSQRAPLGSLVVFAAGDILVAHRLVRRAGGRWVMQGDGRRVPDPPAEAGQILGVVVAAYPGRPPLLARSSRAGAALVLGRALLSAQADSIRLARAARLAGASLGCVACRRQCPQPSVLAVLDPFGLGFTGSGSAPSPP